MKKCLTTIITLVMVFCAVFSAIAEEASATTYEELKKGSKGEAVITLQNRLNELGYSVGTADGDFGNKTETAVKNAQKINHQTETGIATSEFQAFLFSNKVFSNRVSESKSAESNVAAKEEKIATLDLHAINNTNSAKSDTQFVGKSYKIAGSVDWAMPPSDGFNALVVIQPSVQAKGMGSLAPLEINIWMTPYEFEKIGGASCEGKKIDVIATLTAIHRNATASSSNMKGYPIQLEFGKEQ